MAYGPFQSTPPVRGATEHNDNVDYLNDISIHAPRAGGDSEQMPALHDIWKFQSTPPVRGATMTAIQSLIRDADFNPRPPCGGRLLYTGVVTVLPLFQSTPPVRGATLKFESLFGFSNNSCMVIRFLAAPSSLL